MADQTRDPAVPDPTAQRGHAEPTSPDKGRTDGPVSRWTAPAAGFGVSFSTMFRKVLTEEYPEKPRGTEPRYHGRHQLNRHPDGLEKCIGCELCAWACPADAIYVEGADNTDDARYSPGERYGRVYQINYLRCIFCGLCIEACPTRALTMTNEYELADDRRAKLIFDKEQLLAPLRQGMLRAPHPMPPGADDQSYYRGEVTGVSPEQQSWVDARATSTGDTGDIEGVETTGPQSVGEAIGQAHR